MRSWQKHQRWLAIAAVVLLLSCDKPNPPISPTNDVVARPITNVRADLSRTVPRRTVPLVITNAASPEEPQVVETNTPPVIVCGGAQTFSCSSPDGLQVDLAISVQDADGDALSVVWTIDGKDRHTQQVSAADAINPGELVYSYTFTPGDHAIKVTALDGDVESICETVVTVQKDTQPPTIACPADIVLPTDPGQCSAVVTFAVRTSDNCTDVTVTSEPPSGAAFPIGNTTVTCTATDAAGNVAECSFNVTVGITNRCPKHERFWRQNPGAWPLNSMALGNQVYTKSQLLPLLRATVPGDASMVLARQLIVATLNTANGSDPRPICGELTQANRSLGSFGGKLPYRVAVNSAAGRSMVALSQRLDSYNSGMLTPNCAP